MRNGRPPPGWLVWRSAERDQTGAAVTLVINSATSQDNSRRVRARWTSSRSSEIMDASTSTVLFYTFQSRSTHPHLHSPNTGEGYTKCREDYRKWYVQFSLSTAPSADLAATYGCSPSRYAVTEYTPCAKRADADCRGYGHLSGNSAAAFQHLGLYRCGPDYRHDARSAGHGQVDRG